jgi:DnaJ-class molecular chaperone
MSILHDFATINTSFDALGERLLRNLPGREALKSERVESLNVEIWLSPYEALQGVVVPVGIPVFRPCAVCGGSGRDWFSPCLDCGGQGVVETERTVHVRVPPQVREGAIFERPLRGLGIRNLYLRLHIRIGW